MQRSIKLQILHKHKSALRGRHESQHIGEVTQLLFVELALQLQMQAGLGQLGQLLSNLLIHAWNVLVSFLTTFELEVVADHVGIVLDFLGAVNRVLKLSFLFE